MDDIIKETLRLQFPNNEPLTKWKFLKYSTLLWLIKNRISFEIIEGIDIYSYDMPCLWVTEDSFSGKLNQKKVVFRFNSYAAACVMSLTYHPAIGDNRIESIEIPLTDMIDPSVFTPDNCEALVLNHAKIHKKLAKRFLLPIIVPISCNQYVHSR